MSDFRDEMKDVIVRVASQFDMLADVVVHEPKTYAELESARAAGNLIPGNYYILSDYLPVYYLRDSDSSDIIANSPVFPNGGFSGPHDPPLNLTIGTSVTVASLPGGYGGPIMVGDVTTVSFNGASGVWLQFANGLQNVAGATFDYQIKRFANIAADATIQDGNTRDIMRTNGILNTEAHDGNAYGSMTAGENPAPQTETLLLRALSANEFALEAKSMTFDGDCVLYDFMDNQAKNSNGLTLATRNGWISKRWNVELDISLPVDWRHYRERRWELPATEDNNFLNSYAMYQVGGEDVFRLYSDSFNGNKRYIVANVDNQSFYTDFSDEGTATNGNILVDGFTLGAGAALNSGVIYYDVSNVNRDLDLTAADVVSLKDFNVIPLDASLNPENVEYCKMEHMDNVVLMNSANANGQLTDMAVNSKGIVRHTTFTSTGEFKTSASSLTDNLIHMESSYVYNTFILRNCTFMTLVFMKNDGYCQGLRIGSNSATNGLSWCDVSIDRASVLIDTMIGGERITYVNVSNSKLNKCLFKYYYVGNIDIEHCSMIATEFSRTNTTALDILKLNDLFIMNTNPNKPGLYGHRYDMSSTASQTHVHGFVSSTGDIYNRDVTGVVGGPYAESITLVASAT